MDHFDLKLFDNLPNLDHFHLKFILILPKVHKSKSYLQAASGNAVPKSVLSATRVLKVTLFEITFKARPSKLMLFKKDTELNECYRLERIFSRTYTSHFL